MDGWMDEITVKSFKFWINDLLLILKIVLHYFRFQILQSNALFFFFFFKVKRGEYHHDPVEEKVNNQIKLQHGCVLTNINSSKCTKNQFHPTP